MNLFTQKHLILTGIILFSCFVSAYSQPNVQTASGQTPAVNHIGIIGLDTSHSTTFAAMINGEDANPDYADFRVTVAYPWKAKKMAKKNLKEYN